jgi:hypothetical protein
MKTAALTRVVIAAALVGSLAGCGGGGGDSLQAFSAPLKGGIWHGVDSISGADVYGIVAEDGTFRFIRADQVQYTGAATFDHMAVGAALQGFTPLGTAFPDGSVHGTGSVVGTIDSRSSMRLNTEFLTDATNAAPQAGTLNVSYDQLYERRASLATIGGNFRMGSAQDVLTISSTGIVFAQLVSNHCVINGTVAVVDPLHNVYTVTLIYASCTGTSAALNGATLSGIVTLDNSRSPERIFGGVNSAASAQNIVLSMDRI